MRKATRAIKNIQGEKLKPKLMSVHFLRLLSIPVTSYHPRFFFPIFSTSTLIKLFQLNEPSKNIDCYCVFSFQNH